jgi:hypothetical protein
VQSGAETGVVSITANGVTTSTPTQLTITSSASPTPTPSPTPMPASGPTVSIVATDPVAAFKGGNDGRFKISRTGADIKKPLTVLFMVGQKSTGVRGKDFDLSTDGETLAKVTNSITIPAGARNVGMKVVPIPNDAASRPDKTVIIKIKPGGDYKVGTPLKAQVDIAGYSD